MRFNPTHARACSAAAVLGLTAALAAAGPGSAKTRPADCDEDGYNLQAYTYYRDSDPRRWQVYKYTWRLSGGNVRDRNNVNLWLQNTRNDQPTAKYYTASFGADDGDAGRIVNDNREYEHKNRTLVSKRGLRATRFKAIFDKNNSGDPDCNAYTKDL